MRSDWTKLWPAALALGLVIAWFALTEPGSRSQRLTNLDVGAAGFPSTYLLASKSDPSRCFVLRRRDATLRRSDAKQPGRRWRCLRLPSVSGEAGAETWLVRSKRLGKGTALFVAAIDVSDWTYPFLYRFVRERRGELGLPRVGWTQLFVDRLYRGLYLRVDLPFDKRKRDGGSGILRELLTVQGTQLAAVNTRLEPARTLYEGAVADGVFPRLAPPASALAWLARRAPTAGTTFVLSHVEPHELSLLPLPVSLPELFARAWQEPIPRFLDDRYPRWTHGAWRTRAPEPDPFTAEAWAALRAEFRAYGSSLRSALGVQGRLDQTRGVLEAALHARQESVAGLELRIERL